MNECVFLATVTLLCLPFSFDSALIHSTLVILPCPFEIFLPCNIFFIVFSNVTHFFLSFQCISPFHTQILIFVSAWYIFYQYINFLSYISLSSVSYYGFLIWSLNFIVILFFFFTMISVVYYPGSIYLVIGENIFVHVILCWRCYFFLSLAVFEMYEQIS